MNLRRSILITINYYLKIIFFVELFFIGEDGCISTSKEVYIYNYTDRNILITDNKGSIEDIVGKIYPFIFISFIISSFL